MQRCIEPELMENVDQVDAFDSGHKDYAVQAFLKWYSELGGIAEGKLIDLGCGTGDYMHALMKQYPELKITGYDGSETMLNKARAKLLNVVCSNFSDITDSADMVISTNTLHHIHYPDVFWNTAKQISNNVLVMDLVRPKNESTARYIVDLLAPTDHAIFKTDFYNSLLAAFSIEELQDQIKDTNLKLKIEGDPDWLQVVLIYGQFL